MLNVGLNKLPTVLSVIVLMSLSFIFFYVSIVYLFDVTVTTTTLEPGMENVTDMEDIM